MAAARSVQRRRREVWWGEGVDGDEGAEGSGSLDCVLSMGRSTSWASLMAVWWGDDRGRSICQDYVDDQPIRFQHIGLTAQTSLTSLLKLVSLRDLRAVLVCLEEDIADIRETITPGSREASAKSGSNNPTEHGQYDDIEDVARLERLIKAREKTKVSLESRVGWAAMDRATEEAKSGETG